MDQYSSPYYGKISSMRLHEALQNFNSWRGFKVTGKTVVRYDGVLRIFCLCMGNPEVKDIKLQHVLGYLHDLETLGWKRNGITIVALALRKFFEFCNMQGMMVLNEALIPLPRKEFNLPRVANEVDFNQLVKGIPGGAKENNIRNRALIYMIWDTWARAGEIVSLDENELVFNKDGSGKATIKTEKSRGRRPFRQIFWTAKTGKYLKAWLRVKHRIEGRFPVKDNAVFISLQRCGRYDSRGRRMTGGGVCEVMRRISNRAQLPMTLNAHSARHYGGRKIIEAGGSNADVSNLLGHSHLDSSMIYTMLWDKSLEKRYHHFKDGTAPQQKDEFVGSLAGKSEHTTKGGGKFVE